MPELPELEVVKDVLQRRVVGETINAVEVLPAGGAIVVRDLTHRGFAEVVTGITITRVARRGKFLIFSLKATSASTSPLFLVLNPKLTGRLQLASSLSERDAK